MATTFPTGLAVAGEILSDGPKLRVGFTFGVTEATILNAITWDAPQAQPMIDVELWSDAELVQRLSGQSAVLGVNTYTLEPVTLEPGIEYIACVGQIVDGGTNPPLYFRIGAWPGPTTQGPFVAPASPGRASYSHQDSRPDQFTNGSYYGVELVSGVAAPTPVDLTARSPITAVAGDLTALSAAAADGAGTQTWAWAQTSGPPVTIEHGDTATARITPTTAGEYAFTVTVTDDTGTAAAAVALTVTAPNAGAGVRDTYVKTTDGWVLIAHT